MSQPLRAALYLRMSTGKVDQQESPETQRKVIYPFMKHHNYVLWHPDQGEYLDEGVSGGKFEERKELQRLIQDAKDKKFDIIIADKSERFSGLDYEEWNQRMVPWLRGCKMRVHNVVGGLDDFRKKDIGTHFKTQAEAMANHQRLVGISAAILRGSESAAGAGHHLGLIPYGYRSRPINPDNPKSHKKLFRHDPEAGIVEWVAREYNSGHMKLQQIADKLNNDNIPCPKVSKFLFTVPKTCGNGMTW